jgi:hypothetical protein
VHSNVIDNSVTHFAVVSEGQITLYLNKLFPKATEIMYNHNGGNGLQYYVVEDDLIKDSSCHDFKIFERK